MKEKRREREALVDEVVTKLETIRRIVTWKGRFTVVPNIFTRFSAKCRIRENGLREIYDLIAIRCILDTQSDVYAMLGYVHELWKANARSFQRLYR